MEEIWKDIPGYEGLYQASNFGNIRRIMFCNQYGSISKITSVKTYDTEKGYLRVFLCKNGVKKAFRVHRLIALTFLPNINNYSEINHIDFNRHNNSINNLEWCDHSYNINYSKLNNRYKQKEVN